MSKVRTMQLKDQPKALTAAVLLAYYGGAGAAQMGEKVAKLEQPQLLYLFSHFPESDISTIRDAVKGMKLVAETQKDGTKNKGTSEYKVATTRASEIQALYGAWRFGGLQNPEGGYHAAVASARAALKAKAIRWSGDHVKSGVERADLDEARIAGMVAQDVRLAELKAKRTGTPLTDEQAQQVAQTTADTIRKVGAVEMAGRVFRNHGSTFCGYLIEAMEALIATAENKPLQGEEKQAA